MERLQKQAERLEKWLQNNDPKYGTTGKEISSNFTDKGRLAYLGNIGTLFAFFLVCLGVLVLRTSRPALPRPFRCPGGKTVSALEALV